MKQRNYERYTNLIKNTIYTTTGKAWGFRFSCQRLRVLLSSGIWLHIFCCNLPQLLKTTLPSCIYSALNGLRWKGRPYVPPKQWQITIWLHRRYYSIQKKCQEELWQNFKKDVAISTQGKKSLKLLLKHWKVLLVLNFSCHKNVIMVCKLAYLQDSLKIAVNVTRLKEILKWNKDCMNGVNEYMYLITSIKHHWHFMQQNTQIFRT